MLKLSFHERPKESPNCDSIEIQNYSIIVLFFITSYAHFSLSLPFFNILFSILQISNISARAVNADDFVGGHYTQEEMNVALAFLAVIMIMFFAVCACQCYQKVKWECAEKWPPIDPAGIQKRPMPCAPYNRDGQV